MESSQHFTEFYPLANLREFVYVAHVRPVNNVCLYHDLMIVLPLITHILGCYCLIAA